MRSVGAARGQRKMTMMAWEKQRKKVTYLHFPRFRMTLRGQTLHEL
jgi:hypothetical protein